MAWYDNLLQRGTNYFTGNNLTSQDPNTIRAMNAQPFDPNARISDTSFSDRRYEDSGTHHLPLAMPTQTRNLNYNIHQDPPRDWREDYQGTYGAPTPDLYSNEPSMMNLKRDGIMATDQAQDKGNFLQKIMNNTMFGKIAAMNNPLNPNAANFNPALEGQVEDLRAIDFLGPASEGYQIRGGPLAGQNLVSGFGTNDYDQMLAKKAAWFQKRKDDEKGFSQKNWDKVIKEQEARALENQAKGDGAVSFDPRGPTQASIRRERPDKSGLGHRGGFTNPGRDSYGPHKRADGGRIGYQNGELVEQETDFIQGPHGGEEFQETVVEGQEQPSREQLEALAMEIFQLPLEQLDEQQLLVVYQEAMQGQPMEEAVQEEDVQFAANGGLAGLL